MRVLIYVAYDGTSYNGWQKQNDATSIEEELEKAASNLFNQEIEIIGASRTDAGVHALGAAAVFDCDTRMPAEKISYAMNQRLPEDIRVLKSEQVSDEFHPRHCDSRKTYVYRVWVSRFENPINRLYTHHVHVPLDVSLMQEAAKNLTGEHDFKSFASPKAEVLSFVRTIYDIKVETFDCFGRCLSPEDDFECGKSGEGLLVKDDGLNSGYEVRIEVTGNGFLYNMVRIIAGTLIEVGCGRIGADEIPDILEAKDREKSGPTAPAKGLTMKGIEFLKQGK